MGGAERFTERMTPSVPVSVVIPCYRCAHTVERAVASVVAQTVQPAEVILVDDGNDDETSRVLEELRACHPSGWVKLVLLEHNLGAASARNAGWDQAHGRYVAFLDADDSWHPEKIALQYGFMVSQPAVMVCGHAHQQVARTPQPILVAQPVFRILMAFYVLLKNPFITPSFMVRNDLPVRFLPGRRHMEDHLFLMRVAMAGMLIAKTQQPLAYIYKNIFGEAGLSADLWVMQRSELENYAILYKEGYLSTSATHVLRAYSWLKFLRRYVIVLVRQWH